MTQLLITIHFYTTFYSFLLHSFLAELVLFPFFELIHPLCQLTVTLSFNLPYLLLKYETE